MSKTRKWIRCIFWGLFWAAVPLGIAWSLARYSGDLAALIVGTIGAEEGAAVDIPGILGQLKTAELGLPWLWVLAAGLPFGALLKFASNRPGVRRAIVVLGILLFLPVVLSVFSMTRINGILVGKLLGSFLPMLRGVL